MSELERLTLESLGATLRAGERRASIEALGRVVTERPPGALPFLLERLAVEEDPWVTATLVKAVGALGDRSHARLLQEYLHHEDVRVVANTIEALEQVADDAALPLLAPLLAAEDPRVRANAIAAIVHHDETAAHGVVVRMARSDRRRMRSSALYCLSRFTPSRAEPILLDMFEAETADDLIRPEAELLAQVGSKASLGRLVHLGRTAPRDKAAWARFAVVQLAERERVGTESLAGLAEDFEQWRAEAETTGAAGNSNLRTAPATASADSMMTRTARRWRRFLVALMALGLVWRLALGPAADPDDGTASPSGPATLPSPRTEAGNPVDLTQNVPGQTVVLQGRIRFLDRANSLVLVANGGNLLLVHAPGSPLDGLRPGGTVEARGRLTGETNYGATMVREATIRRPDAD